MKHGRHGNIFWACAGGFFATLIMTCLAYMFRSVFGKGLDIATMLGSVIHPNMVSLSAGNNGWKLLANGAWQTGLIWHFFNGAVIFPLLYAYFIYERLSDWTILNEIVRGVAWGLFLWILMELVVMPVLGFGVFGADMHSSVLIAFEAFFLHAIYGGLFGLIAGTLSGRESLSYQETPTNKEMHLQTGPQKS